MSQNPQPKSDFPLTLAEVLYGELYGDPRNQPTGSDGAKLDQEIKTAREKVAEKRNQELRFVNNSWFTSAEQKDWEERKKASEEIVTTIYRAIHFPLETPQQEDPLKTNETPEPTQLPKPNAPRSALCLSGGGVRSATFNLGVLQGLARCKLLGKFEYLSTVSGGGFIGSWLTAWIYRAEQAQPGHGLEDIVAALATPPTSPLPPEPEPLSNLRVYANYLTPRKGFLSPDTWTLIAVYLRNLFLNWCVFIPAIMALLMLPRIWLAFVKSSYPTPYACLIIGFVSGVIALSYISLGLPSSSARRLNRDDTWFVVCCLLPLVITAMALTAYWARLGSDSVPNWWDFIKFGGWMSLLPVILIIVAHIRARFWPRQGEQTAQQNLHPLRALGYNLIALFLIVVAFAVTSLLISFIVHTKPFHPPLSLAEGHGRLYAALAVPALLVMLSGGGTLIAGFTSRYTDVYDQEWWARAGGWILLVATGWSVFHFLVLFCPSLFLDLQARVLDAHWTWTSVRGLLTTVKELTSDKGVLATIIGIVSGAISVFGGFSSKTAAQGPDGKPTRLSRLLSFLVPIAAAIFCVFIIVCLAQITDFLLSSIAGFDRNDFVRAIPSLVPDSLSVMAAELTNFTLGLVNSPERAIVVMTLALAVLGIVLGRMINTNRFSLHYYWRNRMMRAYLGATRSKDERETTRNKFTDFDLCDNLQICRLNQRPFHVVNVTLNLTGGDKLEWQDRKAESFTMSPLHCGSYWLGYRSSATYGGDTGMSLATAAAISGAAASPNMGYMMTSSVVRFIMTLFNVRLGFWLGNPGPAGSGVEQVIRRLPTAEINPAGMLARMCRWLLIRSALPSFNRDSPRESVRPIIAEALGQTNDKSPYVYLSDGGHFENLGLYEMILRRCRFIVVSDASTDTNYEFESLVMAIRQIRVDFGVPIDMGTMTFDKQPNPANNYCAVGLVRYSCADKPTDSKEPDSRYDGVLVYIKPSLLGDEPRDVLNYHNTSPTFPQESIADQWFSEPQFESYRMLGSHMVETICATEGPDRSGKPDHVVIGSAKISAGRKESNEELNIEGWIEKLSPTPGSEEMSDLERSIKAVITVLKGTESEEPSRKSPACADFGDFAGKAQSHVKRARKSAPKDS